MIRLGRGRRRSTEVVLAVPAAGHPAPRELAEEVAKAVAAAGGAAAEVEFVDMTEAEETELRARLLELGRAPAAAAGEDAAEPAHGHAHAGRHAEGGRTAQKGRRRERTRLPTRPRALG